MTDKETDFWTQVFLLAVPSEPPESAAAIADECLAILRKRTQPTAQEAAAATVAELRKSYPWLVLDEDGDLVDPRTGGCPVIGSADGKEWHAYAVPDAHEPIVCTSFAEACRAVSWPDWDAAVKGGDE